MSRYTYIALIMFVGMFSLPVFGEVPQPQPQLQTKPGSQDADTVEVAVEPERKMVKAAFLGVTADRISPAMSSQLKLPQGLGLIVTHVVPGSPAAEADIEKHDILQMLDDQLLVNYEQLAVLIRLHKPSDTVSLSIIRAGESMKIAATLVEREMPELCIDQFNTPDKTYSMRLDNDKARQLMAENAKMLTNNLMQLKDEMKRDETTMKEWHQSTIMPGISDATTMNILSDRFKLGIIDSDHKIYINRIDSGNLQLKVLDSKDKVLFEGPWEPGQNMDSTGLPKEVIDKINDALINPGFGEPIKFKGEKIEINTPIQPQTSEEGV